MTIMPQESYIIDEFELNAFDNFDDFKSFSEWQSLNYVQKKLKQMNIGKKRKSIDHDDEPEWLRNNYYRSNNDTINQLSSQEHQESVSLSLQSSYSPKSEIENKLLEPPSPTNTITITDSDTDSNHIIELSSSSSSPSPSLQSSYSPKSEIENKLLEPPSPINMITITDSDTDSNHIIELSSSSSSPSPSLQSSYSPKSEIENRLLEPPSPIGKITISDTDTDSNHIIELSSSSPLPSQPPSPPPSPSTSKTVMENQNNSENQSEKIDQNLDYNQKRMPKNLCSAKLFNRFTPFGWKTFMIIDNNDTKIYELEHVNNIDHDRKVFVDILKTIDTSSSPWSSSSNNNNDNKKLWQQFPIHKASFLNHSKQIDNEFKLYEESDPLLITMALRNNNNNNGEYDSAKNTQQFMDRFLNILERFYHITYTRRILLIEKQNKEKKSSLILKHNIYNDLQEQYKMEKYNHHHHYGCKFNYHKLL
ncbi:hypothetical protein DERF_008497 [Dermatophagoides farinae]|uniref:Uncharacterized protein n=1 Tax=Dermatophagoides farinae TaxID=6954 RepID=A0A922I1R5_DERFA|nr:hypothetical protein DERF_008497 [Dermatophagoides farinae]